MCVLSCEPPFVEQGDYCIYLTEPKTFEDGCDKKVHELFDVALFEEMETPVWLPVQRRYDFGAFLFKDPIAEYGTPVVSIITEEHFAYDAYGDSWATCLIGANKTMFFVECSEEYSHLCAYNRFQNDDDICSYPALSFEKCFCKLMSNSTQDCTGQDAKQNFSVLGTRPDVTRKSNNVCYMDYRSHASCLVQEQSVPKADLILKFDGQRRELFLTVYSFEG